MSTHVEVAVEVIAQTDLAVLVTDGDDECWIPRSLIDDDYWWETGDAGDMRIPRWLAKREGLIL